jgi:nucleoside-diphosphate-sugar epimerase
MNPITVIGAGGFVGSRLIEALILDDTRDICAVGRTPVSLARLCRFGSAVNLEIADAQNEKAVLQAIKNSSIVVNLVSGDPACIIKSTRAIYNACIQSKVKRLIHLSSAVVYGQVESPEIDDDSPPMKKHWMPYARAKANAEQFLREVINSNPIEITVLRPGIVWGPRSRWSLNAALDLINNTAYLVGDGLGVCNTIYIDNLVSCIQTCCKHNSNTSGFFNVSDDEFVTWLDFYESLADHLNYDISKIPRVPPDRFSRSLYTRFQDLTAHPLYSRLKTRIPLETQLIIRGWVKRWLHKHDNHRRNDQKPKRPQVSREMWHLQRTKNKPPNHKFSKQFNYRAPFSFGYGTQMTINWLNSFGI